MSKYNNFLRNDPFSSFSQLNIDPFFYKNIMVSIIKSLCKPLQGNKIEHSSQEYSITMFFNGLFGFGQNTGTQILE